MRSHKIFWDLTRSFEISQDLLISHLHWNLTFVIWLLSFILCLLTLNFWLLTFLISDIWLFNWPTVDVKISYSLLYIECNVTGTDGNCTGTDDTGMMVLALILKVLTALALMLVTLAQSYLIFTDRFWGNLQFEKNHSLTQWTI